MNIPFVGPTYNSRSSNIDASRSVNFYPEMNPADSKSVIALVNTPGTVLWAQVGPFPVRGMHLFGGLLYVVAGGKLYSIDSTGAVSGRPWARSRHRRAWWHVRITASPSAG